MKPQVIQKGKQEPICVVNAVRLIYFEGITLYCRLKQLYIKDLQTSMFDIIPLSKSPSPYFKWTYGRVMSRPYLPRKHLGKVVSLRFLSLIKFPLVIYW